MSLLIWDLNLIFNVLCWRFMYLYEKQIMIFASSREIPFHFYNWPYLNAMNQIFITTHNVLTFFKTENNKRKDRSSYVMNRCEIKCRASTHSTLENHVYALERPSIEEQCAETKSWSQKMQPRFLSMTTSSLECWFFIRVMNSNVQIPDKYIMWSKMVKWLQNSENSMFEMSECSYKNILYKTLFNHG